MAQMSSLKVKVCPIEWKFVWSPSLFLFLWIFLVDETGWIGWLSDNNSIFFSFPLLREVVRIKGITSLGAYQIHRLTWIPQKLQPETCFFPVVKREKGLSVMPTLHVVHSLHLHKGHKEVHQGYKEVEDTAPSLWQQPSSPSMTRGWNGWWESYLPVGGGWASWCQPPAWIVKNQSQFVLKWVELMMTLKTCWIKLRQLKLWLIVSIHMIS